MKRMDQGPGRVVVGTLTGIGLAIGVVVAVLASDVILGVTAGAAFVAITVGLARLWTGGGSPGRRHDDQRESTASTPKGRISPLRAAPEDSSARTSARRAASRLS